MYPVQMIKNMILNKNINNPILKEVITKAQNGDTKGVEAFARNFLREQGRDFDKEFNEFMKNFK
jgi:hypothetical protein